jgi:hypothetical protein
MKIFKPGLRSVISILVTAFLVLVFAWLGPRALSLYYQVKGGRLLEQALQTSGDVSSEAIPCTLEPVTDPAARTLLEKAVELLDRSARYDPGLSQAYLLQGRAECLLGEYDKAVEALRQYTDLRPKNPLGHLEAGFALASECEYTIQGSPAKGLCGVANLRSSMLDEWREAGIEPENFIAAGSQKFTAHQYQEAAQWFQIASMVEVIQDRELFLWSVAEIMLRHDLTGIPLPQVLPINELNDDLEIKGSAFRWMLDNLLGQSIGNPSEGDPNIGYLSFSGEAIAAIDIHQTSTYHVFLKAQNTAPPPIQLQLEIDFRPVVTIELSRGDGSWEELGTELTLSNGLHILGINFMNDAIIEGKDRNAVIEWVKIQK